MFQHDNSIQKNLADLLDLVNHFMFYTSKIQNSQNSVGHFSSFSIIKVFGRDWVIWDTLQRQICCRWIEEALWVGVGDESL